MASLTRFSHSQSGVPIRSKGVCGSNARYLDGFYSIDLYGQCVLKNQKSSYLSNPTLNEWLLRIRKIFFAILRIIGLWLVSLMLSTLWLI